MLTHSHEPTITVDLFPRTEITHKNHARPISANGQNEKYSPDIEVSLSFHVECVVLMSGLKISRKKGLDKRAFQGFCRKNRSKLPDSYFGGNMSKRA
jgi:hypothetical protein